MTDITASVPLVVLDGTGELGRRGVEVVVDDNRIVARCERELLFGIREAGRKRLVRLGPTSYEALPEHVERRGLNEDEHGFGKLLLDLQGTLDVDLEDERRSGVELGRDLGHERAVHVAVHVGPLEELASLDATFELFLAEEKVVDAVTLAVARRARGSRNRQAETGPLGAGKTGGSCLLERSLSLLNGKLGKI